MEKSRQNRNNHRHFNIYVRNNTENNEFSIEFVPKSPQQFESNKVISIEKYIAQRK